ncbi:MAG: DUF4347 domain-containing protein [Methyloglobulus sp.]|nr:DUF4347 domain-containing protein [Methyloglobulus sp.]
MLEGVDPNATVILLDSTKDGVEQMAQAVAQYDNISAIHIISHGSAGELYLGNATLDINGMQGQYADELAVIKQHLSADADILVCGCNFGEGLLCQVATARLAQLTSADIADSTDQTGSAALGGNWALENRVGSIETQAINTTNWEGLLNVTVNNGRGSFIVVSGQGIYSVNLTTGKATLPTAAPLR